MTLSLETQIPMCLFLRLSAGSEDFDNNNEPYVIHD